MNAIGSSITAILATLSVIPSLAQSLDFPPLLSATSSTGAQSTTSAMHETTVNSPVFGGVAVGQTMDSGSTAKAMWNATSIHANTMSMEASRTGMVMGGDHASMAIYAPMQAVNGALSVAGYISQSRLDDSSVTLAQALSLVARRQINTELKYSVEMSSYSKFDSFITCRLNPSHDSDKAGVAAGLRYNLKF